MNNNTYDILIVGAGMVGTSLALALSSLPIRVALVENFPITTAAHLDADGRSLALTYGSAQILQRLDVWQQLEKFSTPIHTVHISERGHFGITRIKAAEEKVPALGYVVPAPILGAELNKSLLNLTTTTADLSIRRSNYQGDSKKEFVLFNPAKVKALTTLPYEAQSLNQNAYAKWQVVLETEQDTQFTINARLIIAADGTNSTIRTLLNIATHEKDYQQSAIATAVTLAISHNNMAYERFTKHGALAFLPLQGQRGGLVWTGSNEFIQTLQQLSDEAFLTQAQKYFGYRLGKFLQLGKRHIYPLKMLSAQEQVRDGLVLIGNAAHTLHPIAAQGFNLGLLDVSLLTKIISEAIDTGENIGDIEILKKYSIAQQQIQQKIMRFTDTLTHLFAHDFLPLALARNMSLLALDIVPKIKHRLARGLMGLITN